ncbi:hypothetical protein [Aeromonas salmonicida]|uniref:hypothetical protein n=1 Tax=Aeromonas salmonicida TaxID=645 RepID=UPI001EE11FD9|nr:hypothetical protein [Aeromonas salmonicida]
MTDNVSKFISILLLFQSTPLWADTAVMAAGDMWRAEIIYEAVPGVTPGRDRTLLMKFEQADRL